MTNRRDILQFGLGGMAAAATGWALPSQAQRGMTNASAISAQNFHTGVAKVLTRSTRIVVPSYRFGFIVRNGIGASGSSGSTQVDLKADLVGVDVIMMRQIAHLMFSDFIERLRATGRTVVGWNEITGAAAFKKFEISPDPFIKKPFADSRTIAVVTPEYLPLIMGHFDAPLSDKSPLSLGNWRAINALSVELKAVVMIPRLVFDFAALTSSGHSGYGGASVGIQPGLFLVPQMTDLNFFHAKIALAGEGGLLKLEDRIAVGQAGELIKTSNASNRDEVERWNSYARSNMWWTMPGGVAPDRPSFAYDYSGYQYRVDPALLTKVCLDGARAAHGVYMGAVNANRPA